MLIALGSSEVLDAARAAATTLLGATLRRASLPDDAEQDALLVDLALEQASPPDLYRFASSNGKFGADAIANRIRTCVMLRYRVAIATALAEQYRPLNLLPLRFQEMAKNAISVLVSDEWPTTLPQPAALARLLASAQSFKHTDAEGRLHEAWCLNGQYHRNPADGPALVISGSGFKRIAYYLHGELHRPTAYGPALEEHHECKAVLYEYRVNGLLHRPVCDGPAAMFDIGGCYEEMHAENGKLHRNPGDGPAELYDNGDTFHLSYYVEGRLLYGVSEVLPC